MFRSSNFIQYPSKLILITVDIIIYFITICIFEYQISFHPVAEFSGLMSSIPTSLWSWDIFLYARNYR